MPKHHFARLALSAIEDLLKDAFKLSLYETKVYLALLKGTMSANQVSQASRVPLPRVYDTLRSLEEKGFVEEAGDKFQALPPKQVLQGRVAQFEELFRREQEERLKATKRLLNTLEAQYQKREIEDQEINLLRGIHSIANRFAEIFQGSQDIILGVRKAIAAKDLFKPYLARTDRSKKVRILISKDVEVSREDLETAKKAGAELRRCGILLFDVMVSDDREVLIGVPDPLSEDVYHSIAIWLRNPSFAKSIRESLEQLWSTGEKAI
ncbi:MAG: TrmB family transcriptional regulator [Thaumarchaeota archaeon]|nr:TrmB family transcriptional regulator [Nitrososphaerota archaeon]